TFDTEGILKSLWTPFYGHKILWWHSEIGAQQGILKSLWTPFYGHKILWWHSEIGAQQGI
ncbi:unnamed protein product, partial [Allacma fusca]